MNAVCCARHAHKRYCLFLLFFFFWRHTESIINQNSIVNRGIVWIDRDSNTSMGISEWCASKTFTFDRFQETYRHSSILNFRLYLDWEYGGRNSFFSTRIWHSIWLKKKQNHISHSFVFQHLKNCNLNGNQMVVLILEKMWENQIRQWAALDLAKKMFLSFYENIRVLSEVKN